MAKLIVNPTSASRREISLPRSVLSIGRDPSNDLVLPDAMVSRRHAVVEYRGSQYFLRDCNSSNGSLVNGDRVSERGLRDGDLLAIGTARLLFRDDVDTDEVGAKVVHHPSSPRLVCPSCGSDYRKGDQFCRQCGGSLAPKEPAKVVCTACGTAVPIPARFCSACGRPLPVQASAPPVSAPTPDLQPGSEAVPDSPGSVEAVAPPAPSPAQAPAGEPAGGEDKPPVTEEAEIPPELQASAAEPHGPAPAAPVVAAAAAPAMPPVVPPRPAVSAAALKPLASVLSSPQWQGRGAHREETSRVEPVGFGPRLLAGLVDAAIVALGQSLLLVPVAWYWGAREASLEPAFLPILLSLAAVPLALLLGGAYFVYYWGAQGATPGKRLLGLAVVGEDGACPIGYGQAAVRAIGYLASALLLGFGFLMIARGGSGLHDHIAGTRVVRREGA